MTSKNLFFKVCFHDFKKRIWSVAILFVIMFFAFPVSNMLTTQMYGSLVKNGQGVAEYAGQLQEYYIGGVFSFVNGFYIFLLIAAAVMMAVSGFAYLNSRKKVDFIHSMPIKRESLFAAKFLVGIVNYVLPLLLNVGLSFFVVLLRSNSAFKTMGVTVNILAHIGWFLLMNIVYFLLFYSIAVLVMVLVGNTIIAFLGIGVFYFYQTLVSQLFVLCKRLFYDTYLGEYETIRAYDPIALLIRQIDALEDRMVYGVFGLEKIQYDKALTNMFISLGIIVVAIVIAVILMKKRASESAGKALAFKYSEPIIKIAIIGPSVVAGGLFMYLAALDYSIGWFIFGAVICFLLLAVILEMIFRLDFRGALRNKWSAFVGGGVAVLITLFFVLDLSGFDKKIPKLERIESVGISFGGIGMEDYVADRYDEETDTWYNCDVIECTELKGDDLEKAYDLAQYLAKNHNDAKDGIMGRGFYIIEDSFVTEEDGFILNEGSVQLCYRLKNGKEIYRNYYIYWTDEVLEYVEDIYQCEPYQQVVYPILTDENEYFYIDYLSNLEYDNYQFEGEQAKEFLELYKEELRTLTLETVLCDSPVMLFELMGKSGTESSGVRYPIYESFEKTRDYMKELGLIEENELIDVNSIGNITIINYGEEYREIEYKDPEEKKEILKNCINPELCYWSTNYKYYGEYEVSFNHLNEDVEEYYYLREIPDFVKEDFEK